MIRLQYKMIDENIMIIVYIPTSWYLNIPSRYCVAYIAI